MPAFPADVEVAIVTHNARGTLPDTLESLWRAGCPPAQVTIVDVASSDGSPEWIHATWPEIRQIRLHRNLGPSPGRNQGILQARCPFVFLMDADVMVEPDTVQLLREAMHRDPSIAIGSPVVVHASQPDLIQYAGTGLHFICEAVNPWLDRPLAERGPAPDNIGVASTCALLIERSKALEYGLFDERYFIGKEDGDFTHRARLAGHKIWEMPQALVRHRSRPRGTWLFYYQIRNRWHFMLKNYEVRTLCFIAPALLVHETLQGILLILKGHGITYLKACAGLLGMLPALAADRARVRRIRVVHDAATRW
jgi:GT2 family glycosyltransferase